MLFHSGICQTNLPQNEISVTNEILSCIQSVHFSSKGIYSAPELICVEVSLFRGFFY